MTDRGSSCTPSRAAPALSTQSPPGIETIQCHHRYAVAWPSIHPTTGLPYQWRDDDPGRQDGEIPYADDFPRLPGQWVDALADTSKRDGHGFSGTVEDWLDQLPDNRLSATLAMDYNRRVRSLELLPGSRHDTMVKTVNWLVHLGAERHNVREALHDLYETFLCAVESDRDGEAEYFSALSWATRTFGSDNGNDR